MQAELYPIADCPSGRLAIMPRPRAGDWLEGEVESWRSQGIELVVSLLEDTEVAELHLEDEAGACQQVGLRFVRFPVPDRGVPRSSQAVSDLVSSLVKELRAGHGVGIHCRIGVGRSASLAVCVLAALGTPIEVAWETVEKARGLSVPDTPEQRAWVAEWVSGCRVSSPNPCNTLRSQ